MRKAFPQKILADLGLDASAPPSKARGRRRRTNVTAAPVRTAPVRAKAATALAALTRTLQPELDEIDRAW
jgi:hypothetical protein